MICSDGFGGVERYVAALAPRLAARGHEVTVIGGDRTRMAAAVAGDCRFLPADTPAQARSALGRIGHVDIVNTHMSEADIVGIRHRAHTAQVSTRHFSAPRGTRGLRRVAMRALSRRIDAELSISQHVAEAIRTPSIVVRTGVDDADASARAARTPTVLMAQRLEPEKAGVEGIRAWARSAAPERGWRLQIAGDGSQRAALAREADVLGVTDTVDFLGYRDDIGDLMGHAGLLLAPTPREGLGLAVIEAMARALPVVAAASGGHLETVGAVDRSTLFPPGDPGAAAHALDELIADEDRREALGTRLQRHQRTHLSTHAWVTGTLAVFEKAVVR